jgi:hypothetical protein
MPCALVVTTRWFDDRIEWQSRGLQTAMALAKWHRPVRRWLLGPMLAVALVAGAAQPASGESSRLQESFRITPPEAHIGSGFGWTVALSSDRNTALIGDREGAWVFVRSGAGWVKQAGLSNPAPIGGEGFGCSVALSADGNTALVGETGRSSKGPPLRNSPGAAWVFTRQGRTWSLQAQLTPADEANPGQKGCQTRGGGYWNGFGFSVALSADGNTALVGDGADNLDQGAAWVFTRNGTSWTQQEAKLVAKGERSQAQSGGLPVENGGQFGTYVALSADGDTALITSPLSGSACIRGTTEGQAWIFTRTAGSWQQSQELAATTPRRCEGSLSGGIALSGDGKTALIGQPAYDRAWAFVRSASGWSQQGRPLAPESEAFQFATYPPGRFGELVALNADGGTALVSGLPHNSCGKYFEGPCGNPGAVWTLSRIGGTWVRRGARLVGPGEFGDSLALSPGGDFALIGAPDPEGRGGFVLDATVAPPTPNAFYRTVLTVDRKGVIRPELVSSSAGTLTAVATVGSRALRHLPRLRCHRAKKTHRRVCPREGLAVYGRATAAASGPGPLTLVLAPSRAVRVAFARYHSLSLKVHVTSSFTPAMGPSPASQAAAVNVERGTTSESSG